MAKIHLTLLLLKEDTTIDSVLVEGCKCIDLDGNQKLYYKETAPNTPKWVTIFLDNNENAKRAFRVQGSSAVILFQRHYDHGDRTFAITFGYGRNLIKQGVIEERFGLITTLSSIDKEKIRSLDLSSLETVLLNSRIQASALSGIENFSLNLNRDLLKAVTGKLEEDGNSSSLTGKDSLGFSSKCTYRTIGTEIDKYYNAYKSGRYKDSFKWVDKIQDVKDSNILDELNNYVVECINGNHLDNIWIAYPDIINWGDLDHFKFGRKDYIEDVNMQIVQRELIKNDDDKITVGILRSRMIHACNSEDKDIAKWSLYKCLYVDYQKDDKQFFLQEGKWFMIERNFVNEINDFYNNVPIYSEELPDYDYRTEDEYNHELVRNKETTRFLMDKKLQKIDGDEFELCDVMTSGKEFIHVKKFTSSAVLSHLFNQGLVSAECVKNKQIRIKANDTLPDGFKLDTDSFNANEYKIVFVIAKKSADSRPNIPFFSKVALENVANTLSLIGYQFAIKGVPFTYVDTEKERKKKEKRDKAKATLS